MAVGASPKFEMFLLLKVVVMVLAWLWLIMIHGHVTCFGGCTHNTCHGRYLKERLLLSGVGGFWCHDFKVELIKRLWLCWMETRWSDDKFKSWWRGLRRSRADILYYLAFSENWIVSHWWGERATNRNKYYEKHGQIIENFNFVWSKNGF